MITGRTRGATAVIVNFRVRSSTPAGEGGAGGGEIMIMNWYIASCKCPGFEFFSPFCGIPEIEITKYKEMKQTINKVTHLYQATE